MYQAYSIYIMSYGQYYLLTVVCGFIASMLAASVPMLVSLFVFRSFYITYCHLFIKVFADTEIGKKCIHTHEKQSK